MFDFIKRFFKSTSNGRPSEPEFKRAATAPLASHATAPLISPEATIGSDSPIRMAHSQSVGRVRDHNEDVLLTLTSTFEGDEKVPSFGLYIVADGMGGHSLGERASAVAARMIAREVTKRVYLALLDDSSDTTDRAPLQQVMEEALGEANRAVVKAVGEGGTTGTAALVFNDQLIIGHVGDSRAYLITNNGIEQITRDHSLVQRLVELGQLSPAEAAIHNQKNVLYKAIGQGEGLEADVNMHRLSPGAKILLCSDGLWGYVDETQLLNIIRQAPSLKLACDKMVNAANEAGGPDNITAVLIEYSP